MYEMRWDEETGGILLIDTRETGLGPEVRPVFHEELNLLGFGDYWSYPQVEEPLLWALGGRKYYYRGELVAEAEGGGLFSPPKLKIHRPGLHLEPVEVEPMLAKNSGLLQGLVQRSLRFICQTYSRYRQKVDVVAMAFSGGKDSLVVLDLVQRVLEPDQFAVVFGDTGMEVSDTYRAVEEAKLRWPHLSFYTARSRKDALTTWREMGPPSRIHRWCCSVHKTVPTLLLLRELVGKASVRALIFDGVRHEESASRAAYTAVTRGGKHKVQINASPIIAWNAGEVFLYLFGRRLLLNRAYRYGATRVGCAVCPMASQWKEAINGLVYREGMQALLGELRSYAINAGVEPTQVGQFVEEGGWKHRAGGRYLSEGGNRVVEEIKGDKVTFTLRRPTEEWQEWAKALGRVVHTGRDRGYIERNGTRHPYILHRSNHSLSVEVSGLGHADRFVLKAFRAVALKSAYCLHCQACQVECPTGALVVHERIRITEDCHACGLCLDLHGDACLAAKSLVTTEGGTNMHSGEKRSLPSYQTFGLREDWLAEFFRSPQDWVSRNCLGNRQFEAMVLWLKHAELIGNLSGSKRSVTVAELGEKLAQRGTGDLITWAVIWTNLARNSTLVRWYLSEVPWGAIMTKAEWVAKMGETLAQSERMRENAATALFSLLTRTPLGEVLGLGEKVRSASKGAIPLNKKGWHDPSPVAVLYSLYRYAERLGRYELTVGELYNGAEEGPYTVFGVRREVLEAILRGLAARAEGLVRVSIVRDLDNIFLDPARKASEVLDIV